MKMGVSFDLMIRYTKRYFAWWKRKIEKKLHRP